MLANLVNCVIVVDPPLAISRHSPRGRQLKIKSKLVLLSQKLGYKLFIYYSPIAQRYERVLVRILKVALSLNVD